MAFINATEVKFRGFMVIRVSSDMQAGITEIEQFSTRSIERIGPMKTESTKSWRRLTLSSKVCVHNLKHWKHGPSNRLSLWA